MREVRPRRPARARTLSLVQFVRTLMSIYEVAGSALNLKAAWRTERDGPFGWMQRGNAAYNGEIHPLSFLQVSYAV
jgi:hypothetical protein